MTYAAKPATTLWQHATPQRDIDHAVAPETRPSPSRDGKVLVRMPPTCTGCHKRLIQVDEDDGPESLKSLLRIR